MNAMVWVISGLAGAAALLAVIGLWPLIAGWYARDHAWVARTALRFSPKPVDVDKYTRMYLMARILVLFSLLALIPSVVVAIAFWLILMLVPKYLVGVAWEHRRSRIDEQLPQAVASMANTVQAGLTLVQAIERMADGAPDPIRTEFQIIANRYALGSDLGTALVDAKQRLSLPNFNLFVSALMVNREMGGQIAQTLDRISTSIAKLHELRQTMYTSTAEGRTNIKVLSLAPIFILGLLYFMDPEGVEMLFTTPQGWAVLTIAGLLVGTGTFWASRILQVDL